MTIYSSGKHEKLTADPEPWKNLSAHGGRWPHESRDPLNDALRPRPEFDRPLTNPANPILSAFRASSSSAETWLIALHKGGYVEGTPAQIKHAHRVLTRLAANYNEKE